MMVFPQLRPLTPAPWLHWPPLMHWHDRLTARRLGMLEAWPAPPTAVFQKAGRFGRGFGRLEMWSFWGKDMMINDNVCDVGASMVMI